MQIQNSVFIVTGGASGLGQVAAQMLADCGANIVIADVNTPAEPLGPRMQFIKTDVTDAASAQAAVAFAKTSFGRLSGLINCAGIAPAEKVLGKDGPHRLDAFARVVSINLVGSFNMLRLAAQAISETASADSAQETAGVIINTASVAAFDGQIGQAAYAASKAGIVGMTLPIARELARSRIRVMTIAPGIFRTPMVEGFPQHVQDALGAQVPHPSRLGDPTEYAQLVESIIRNPMLNGEVIRLDGAIRMAPR